MAWFFIGLGQTKPQPMKNLLFISLFFILFSACKKECELDNEGYFKITNNTDQPVSSAYTNTTDNTMIVCDFLPHETKTITLFSGNYNYEAITLNASKNWSGWVVITDCETRSTTFK